MKTRRISTLIIITAAVCVLILSLVFLAVRLHNGPGIKKTADSPGSQVSEDRSDNTSPSLPALADNSAEHDDQKETENSYTPFEPNTTGSAITPQKAPEDLALGYRATIAETDNWCYFITETTYGEREYQMVCRDNPDGNLEVLYGLAQTDEYVMNISYVERSYEESGGTFLYFSIENGLTLHQSIYCFNLETSYFNAVLFEPCSNMVIFYDAPADIKGLGWVLYGDCILPINLSDASSYEGMTKGIEDLGDMSTISYSFFFTAGDSDEFKYSLLDALPGGILKIQVVTFSPGSENPESRVTYEYDCINQKIQQVG